MSARMRISARNRSVSDRSFRMNVRERIHALECGGLPPLSAAPVSQCLIIILYAKLVTRKRQHCPAISRLAVCGKPASGTPSVVFGTINQPVFDRILDNVMNPGIVTSQIGKTGVPVLMPDLASFCLIPNICISGCQRMDVAKHLAKILGITWRAGDKVIVICHDSPRFESPVAKLDLFKYDRLQIIKAIDGVKYGHLVICGGSDKVGGTRHKQMGRSMRPLTIDDIGLEHVLGVGSHGISSCGVRGRGVYGVPGEFKSDNAAGSYDLGGNAICGDKAVASHRTPKRWLAPSQVSPYINQSVADHHTTEFRHTEHHLSSCNELNDGTILL